MPPLLPRQFAVLQQPQPHSSTGGHHNHHHHHHTTDHQQKSHHSPRTTSLPRETPSEKLHSPRPHGNESSTASLSPRSSFYGHYAQPMDVSDGADASPPPRRSLLPAVPDATPRDREVQSMPMLRPPRAARYFS
jgi:hypothetical protein